jgi:hypothetical protein
VRGGALIGKPLPDGAMPIGHVEDHGLGRGRHGAAEQRQPDRLVVGDDRADMHGAMAVPAQRIAGEAAVRALGDRGQCWGACEQVLENAPAAKPELPLVTGDDAWEVLRRLRAAL